MEGVAKWQRRLLPAELLESAEGRRSAWDWVVDFLLILAAFAIGALSLDSAREGHSDTLIALDLLAGTIVCLALWVRRRHPVGVAVAAVSVSSLSLFAAGAAIVSIFNVAVRSSRRALLAISGLSVGAMVVGLVLNPSEGSRLGQLLFGLLLLAVAIGWGLFVRARLELVHSLRERAERAESEERLRLEQARESERRRIAREMHDVLAHRLSLLSVHAGALEFRPDAEPQEVAEAAGVIRATAQTALQELRDVIGVLREDAEQGKPQPPQPTLAQLPALIEESRAAGMHITLDMDSTLTEGLPGAVGRTAYRVVQEGLTNARKHAPGAAVGVTISTDDHSLLVTVANRRSVAGHTAGLGGSGAGLVGLAERVSLAGGELKHGTDQNGDFVLTATIPSGS